MKLDRVTFTGADDSIAPDALIPLSKKYPWVEWGILMVTGGTFWGSGSRFPSLQWIEEMLKATKDEPGMNFCAHLCSGWVDDIMWHRRYAFGQHPIAPRFARVQLNFHAQRQNYDAVVGLRNAKRQFIFQVDGVNDNNIRSWVAQGHGSPLFDISGGAGTLPEEGWPKFWDKASYCGYAGGLGPNNVVEQVKLIEAAAGDNRIWIDMETRVRSKDDALFDLDKCQQVCEAIAPYITV